MIERGRQFFRRKFVRDTLILQVSKIGITGLGLVAWLIVPVTLGTENYGIWALVQSFLAIWLTFNLTGISMSTATLLPVAIGAGDADRVRDLLALLLQVSLAWGAFSFVVLALIGPPLALQLYGATEIGALAALLAVTLLIDPFYHLVIIALRSRRSMRAVAVLQNANQLVLTICLVTAALLRPEAGALVVARLVYSAVTALLALVFYQRQRAPEDAGSPPLRAVMRHTLHVSYRPYWRFGLANALDKNVANLYLQLPLQLVGIFAGTTAVSHLQLALRGIEQTAFFTSAVFENMQAVVPQAIGRGDYARLWANFFRVLVVLTVGSALFYLAFALLAPLVIVPLFGEEWLPVLPLLPILALFGVVTTIGGIFGPLYRALNRVRWALLVKVLALVLLLPVGLMLIDQTGAVGGAWLITGLYALSVALTAVVTLPVLRRLARAQVADKTDA